MITVCVPSVNRSSTASRSTTTCESPSRIVAVMVEPVLSDSGSVNTASVSSLLVMVTVRSPLVSRLPAASVRVTVTDVAAGPDIAGDPESPAMTDTPSARCSAALAGSGSRRKVGICIRRKRSMRSRPTGSPQR